MRTIRGALALLAGIAACLGAVAYAATPRHSTDAEADGGGGAAATPPRPKITLRPEEVSASTSARFGFRAPGRNRRFQCRLDAHGWSPCHSPIVFDGLAPGRHGFAVRVVAKDRAHGRAARFRWSVLEPKAFSIAPRVADLDRLYPGAPPLALPLTISNPNPMPIQITALRAATSADPPGCGGAENILLTPSSASSASPLVVPAGGSVSLPASGVSAPTIQLRDLPVNQDACQGARFPLTFSGEARG